MADSPTDRIRSLFDQYVQHVRSGARPDRAATLASAPPDSRAELERLIEEFHSLSERGGRRTAPYVVGNRVGEYLLVRELGSGGLGGVWEAERADGQRVALKLLHLQHQFSHEVVQRFQREGKVGQRLHHPGIVQVLDFGEVSGTPYLAQELIPGGRTVRDWVAESRSLPALPKDHFTKVAEVFAEIAEALDVVHRAGIVHRDIKPGNILLTPEGRPKIADFGAVKDLDPAATQGQTVDGNLVGTYSYLSPEQSSAKRLPVDPRADIFSLGATLYEALTLEQAFPGDTPQQILQKILLEDPIAPQKLRSQVPGPLALICLKCMEKRPGHRYASMADLAAELRRYLRKEAILTRAPGPVAKAWKWSARNPVKSTAGTVTVAALIAISALAVKLAWALQAESQRADELDQVAKFQEEQLSGIDADAMGWGIRTALFEKVREAGERVKREPEVIEAQQKQLEEVVAGADWTKLALETLDEHFFQGALEAVEEFHDQPLVKARLLQAVASTLQEVGLIWRAEEPQVEALRIRRERLGSEHEDTLISINNMGLLLESQGKLDEAEPYTQEALELCRRIFGSEHPGTLSSIGNMGALLESQGKLEEAEPYFKEALETRRRVLGSEDPDTLISIDSMGMLLDAQGKLTEAELYLREALETSRRVLGSEHPDTLISISNMGMLLDTQGKLTEAEPYLREALETSRRVLGSEHPDTLNCINNMGTLLQAQSKPAEAEPYLREALESRRRVMGSEHPDTLISINNMGALLESQGKLDEAEPYYQETAESSRRLLGSEHPVTLTSISNMGVLLESQGKLEEAEPYFREALETSRRVMGSEHPDTLSSINNMGFLLDSQGKLEEAEPYYIEALEISRRVLESEHPLTLSITSNMGMLLRDQGRLTEAEPYCKEALEIRRRVLGSEHRDTLISLNSMGSLLTSQGKLTEAEPYFRESLETRRRVLGSEDPATLISINNLGYLLQTQGQLAEADSLLREALLGRQAVLGADNLSTFKSLKALVGLWAHDPSRLEERISWCETYLAATTSGSEAHESARALLQELQNERQ